MAFNPDEYFAESSFNPDEYFGEIAEKEEDTIAGYGKDILRLFAPLAATGVNAIIGGVEGALKGENILEAASVKAQSPEFLGLDLSMETEPGKFVEENLGKAFEAVRGFMGEAGADLLRNPMKREFLKVNPVTSPLANLYEYLGPEGKRQMEAVAYSGASVTPEIAATILGGRAASKAIEKKPEALAEEGTLVEKPIEEPSTTVPQEQLPLFEEEAVQQRIDDVPPVDGITQQDWIKEFKSTHPEQEGLASKIYSRLKEAKDISGSDLVNALDRGLGAISTRVGNIHPQLQQKLVDFEFYNLRDTGRRLQSVDKFLTDINREFPKADRQAIDSLLINNNYDELKRRLPPQLKQDVNQLQSTLSNVGDELVKFGIIKQKRENYFPRVVKDLDGLYNAIGKEIREPLQKIIAEKELKGGPLSEIELTDTINSYLQGNYNRRGKPGFSKGRVFEQVPEELQKFYASPTESLHSYLRSATFQIERAKFFGKDAVKNEAGRMELGQSIGAYTARLMNEGKIKPDQVQELSDILNARFGGGQRPTGAVLQGLKDVTHIGLLGDVSNALMQVADAGTAIALDGVRPTLLALAGKLRGADKVTARDLGLLNNISDEFVSDRATTRAVTKTFKLSGLAKIDELVKDLNLNAALRSAQRTAKIGNKNDKLFLEYSKRFGDEFPQLLADLQAGRKTDLTDRFVFSELAMRQPISKSEFSQTYLQNPNIRPAYVLKSFMLKQADLYRNRVFKQIKEGNTKVGLANAAKLAVVMSAFNLSMDTIRDYLSGKPIEEFDETSLPAAFFKIFGYNEYFSEDLQRGAFGEALSSIVAPPVRAFDPLTQDIVKALHSEEEATGKWKTYIPIFGDALYWYSEEGKAEKERREMQAFRKQLKEEME